MKEVGPWELSGALIGGLWSVELRLEPSAMINCDESLVAIRVGV